MPCCKTTPQPCPPGRQTHGGVPTTHRNITVVNAPHRLPCKERGAISRALANWALAKQQTLLVDSKVEKRMDIGDQVLRFWGGLGQSARVGNCGQASQLPSVRAAPCCGAPPATAPAAPARSSGRWPGRACGPLLRGSAGSRAGGPWSAGTLWPACNHPHCLRHGWKGACACGRRDMRQAPRHPTSRPARPPRAPGSTPSQPMLCA